MSETMTKDEKAVMTGANGFGEALCARDPKALEQFFDVWFPLVHGYVRRQVIDEHVAEDLTQDIFLNLHRSFESYDPERDLTPWVYRIATNKIRDYWRSSHKNRTAQQSPDAEEDLVDRFSIDEVRPEETLVQAELSDEMWEAVHQLPEGLRDTIVMRVYHEMSFEAIGKALDRNAAAVRKRYSRALSALRECLEGHATLSLESA